MNRQELHCVDFGTGHEPGCADFALLDVFNEYTAAVAMYKTPFYSAHEGLSILQEEVKELADEVYIKQGKRDPEKMRKEAVQVAAMALRFITDISDAGRSQK